MKKEHTIKNPLKKLSLQWRLTLIITLLMTVTCILMYFFISSSAVTGIEDLGDYVVKINETDSTPITFNINPNTLFAGLSDQVQETKDLFRTRSIIATAIIILLSSVGTYFISRRALLPLRRLSNEVNKIEAQNLSESLEVPDTNDEISRLTGSFNKMLSRLDDAFTAQKQFSASAAHELRTPLAVMQTNLEVFARKNAPTVKEYQELAGKYDFEIVDTGINTSADIDMAATDLVSKVDCLCNLTDNTVVNALQTVLDKADNAKIPVFGSEIEQVKSGCVASMGIDYYQLGIETGKMAAKILKGEEKASETPYITASKAELYVNTAAADKIGMKLDASYVKDAAQTFDEITVK